MLTLIPLALIPLALAAAAASVPLQVQSTPARESSNQAAGFGKRIDQSALETHVVSISSASIQPDGSVQLSCETHRTESPELAHNEQPK